MAFSLNQAALSAYLKRRDDAYFGKLVVLRDEITQWLAYTPATFPHYTSHTIDHSDEIVTQLSHLLFDGGDPNKPVLHLSSAEAYILIAAAYLHDAGMVASDAEKLSILKSAEWETWVTGSAGGARRWREIEQLRTDTTIESPVRNFLADLQTRFLIAEFIRARHHIRASDVISQHGERLGGLSFGDPALQRTIADVCVAHGLRQHELEDKTKYPDRRDIRGDQVNVRLLAILLRLGDLLDMRCDRACPLLLNAACPLPADSLAHWTQYQRISHKLVAPDRIEIRAECESQEEHMFLQDWCQWLVQEARNADVLVARFHRHADWKPPFAEMDSEQKSIEIVPARGAKYIPSRWTFELDRDLILERFVQNVHESKEDFIRELLQNAFDANRCKMYLDLGAASIPQPESPTKVDAAWRERYPVFITLETRTFPNAMSGENEEKQVLTIDDRGIGMDRDVISRFFLQVGRSYYNTDEFRKRFSFSPTSQFGVGFLSVFSSSDDVRVETWKPTSNDGPLRLRLRGAKSYLLTERGDRKIAGTRIEIVLEEPLTAGHLTELISGWCRRVEFPILVDELGKRTEIRAETPSEFVSEAKDISQPNASFAIVSHPIDEPGVEGELYTLVHTVNSRHRWITERETVSYQERNAGAVVPSLPDLLGCLNGIAVATSYAGSDFIVPRIDFRRRLELNLARIGYGEDEILKESSVRKHIERILRDHLTSVGCSNLEDWTYWLRLARDYEYLRTFWDQLKGGILLTTGSDMKGVSLDEAATLMPLTSCASYFSSNEVAPLSEPALLTDGLTKLPRYFAERLFLARYPESVEVRADGSVLSRWVNGDGNKWEDVHLVPFEGRQMLRAQLYFAEPYSERSDFVAAGVALNTNHPVMIWFKDLQGANVLTEQQLAEIRGRLQTAAAYSFYDDGLTGYLISLKRLPNLPKSLAPPKITSADLRP